MILHPSYLPSVSLRLGIYHPIWLLPQAYFRDRLLQSGQDILTSNQLQTASYPCNIHALRYSLPDEQYISDIQPLEMQLILLL